MRTVLGLVVAMVVAASACAPAPSAPPGSSSPTPSLPPSPSPRPTGTPVSGATTLTVSASVKQPCVPPPEGCGYGATLVLPGGAAMHADFALSTSTSSIVLGEGLPASLPWGSYGLVFEVVEYSDVVSFVPLDDGTMGTAPPTRSVACTARLDVRGDQPAMTVRVTFDGFDCSVRIRP